MKANGTTKAPGRNKKGSRKDSTTKTRAKTRKADDESAGGGSAAESEASGEEYQQSESESEDVKAIDSDDLDGDEEFDEVSSRKRKRGSATSTPVRKTKTATRKSVARRKRTAQGGVEEELDLAEGQVVVGRVVQAPKTGHVPAGQISQNTFNFLSELKKPECNDREWCVQQL